MEHAACVQTICRASLSMPHEWHDQLLQGASLTFSLDAQVSRIKERVEEKEGIPPVQQRLIFGGKQM